MTLLCLKFLQKPLKSIKLCVKVYNSPIKPYKMVKRHTTGKIFDNSLNSGKNVHL